MPHDLGIEGLNNMFTCTSEAAEAQPAREHLKVLP